MTGSKPCDNMGRLARSTMQSNVNKCDGEGSLSSIRASGCLGRDLGLLYEWNLPIHLLDNKAGSKKLTLCAFVHCRLRFLSPWSPLRGFLLPGLHLDDREVDAVAAPPVGTVVAASLWTSNPCFLAS